MPTTADPEEAPELSGDWSPDDDLENADWLQTTWDLFTPAHTPIATIEELRVYLADQRLTPAAFKQLPVYRANVATMPWLRQL